MTLVYLICYWWWKHIVFLLKKATSSIFNIWDAMYMQENKEYWFSKEIELLAYKAMFFALRWHVK